MASRIEKERIDLIYKIVDDLLRREPPYGSTGEERRNIVLSDQHNISTEFGGVADETFCG
jgi:hypothetical protein